MPAHAKLATALAMALALVGAGTSLAQSATAPGGHSVYVTLVDVQGTTGPEELTGHVSCDVPLHERVIRRTLDRHVCLTDEFAYAYPADRPAPWTASIRQVNQSMYVDESGSMWQVAEVTYTAMASAPEGGPELVKAMASEILPQDGKDEPASYALPVDEELLDQTEEELTVGVGPSPDEAKAAGPQTTLPSN